MTTIYFKIKWLPDLTKKRLNNENNVKYFIYYKKCLIFKKYIAIYCIQCILLIII